MEFPFHLLHHSVVVKDSMILLQICYPLQTEIFSLSHAVNGCADFLLLLSGYEQFLQATVCDQHYLKQIVLDNFQI